MVSGHFAGESFQNFVWLWWSFSNNRPLRGGGGHFNKTDQSSNEQELK